MLHEISIGEWRNRVNIQGCGLIRSRDWVHDRYEGDRDHYRIYSEHLRRSRFLTKPERRPRETRDRADDHYTPELDRQVQYHHLPMINC